MKPANGAKCANCRTNATTRCSGCMNAPEYKPGDSLAVIYCGRECQRDNWPNHKAHCNAMRKRTKLLRAAMILKSALLTYKEVVYDVDLTKIDFHNGILRHHQKQRSVTAPAKRGPFPSHLTSNIEHKEAALAINQCTTAMALLGRLTRKLLAGVASTIEIVDIQVGKPLVPTKLVPGPDSDGCPHTILKVGQLSAAETWAIDTTGCQYGFRDVLIPFETYLRDKTCQMLNQPATYDATETKDLDHFSTLPFMNKTRAQRRDKDLERQARLHFAVFVDTRVSKDILDGSETDFKDKMRGFADELKLHMMSLPNK